VLEQDEFIVEISGRCGNWVDHLTIKTNKGKVLSVGGNGGSEKFNIMPQGQSHQIVGAGGACGGYLHNLYVYYL